eukprot:TRINITY_DN9700_c1_g1_i1.p2 TRINITY_DN9700_c1_g1~~TRINITY_DN9700_c1_g1_i1.p2  ORF type:complete len:115 (+),score=16.31 TRINITY_DN9700_c1_g1_i1:811-1155(+)
MMGSLGKVLGLGKLGMVGTERRGYRWGRWGLDAKIFVGQWIRTMGLFLYVMGIDKDGVVWWTGARQKVISGSGWRDGGISGRTESSQRSLLSSRRLLFGSDTKLAQPGSAIEDG